MLKGQRWSPIKVNTRDSGSCDEMLISKYQACPNWVFSLGAPNFVPEASKKAPHYPSQYVLISYQIPKVILILITATPSLHHHRQIHDVVWVFRAEHEGVVESTM